MPFNAIDYKSYKKIFDKIYFGCLKRSKKFIKFSEYFPWEGDNGFYELYLSGEEPLEFVYKNKVIVLQNGNNQSFLYLLLDRKGIIEKLSFDNQNQLLYEVKIDGKSLIDIWDELK